MEAYCRSDIGRMRSSNQDACYCCVASDNCAWAIVCDGMGGANGGSEASSTAVEYINREFSEKFTPELSRDEIEKLMTDTVIEANTAIYEKASANAELSGMGTTCEFVLVKSSEVFIVHVGDSRTYSIRGGKIKQITEDHSVVWEMVKRGELTPQEAENHPNKNYITRALGIKPEVKIDFIQFEFSYGDVILTCSDGLSNTVSTIDMIRISHENRGEQLVEKLIEKANSAGGPDNITASVIY